MPSAALEEKGGVCFSLVLFPELPSQDSPALALEPTPRHSGGCVPPSDLTHAGRTSALLHMPRGSGQHFGWTHSSHPRRTAWLLTAQSAGNTKSPSATPGRVADLASTPPPPAGTPILPSETSPTFPSSANPYMGLQLTQSPEHRRGRGTDLPAQPLLLARPN